VHRLFYFLDDKLSDYVLGEVFRLIVAGCPQLESLSVDHGLEYDDRKHKDKGKAIEVPALGDALVQSPLPASLITLSLQNIQLRPFDFEACNLPELKLVRLVGCGEGATGVAESLLARCPKLLEADQVSVCLKKRNESAGKCAREAYRVPFTGLSFREIQAALMKPGLYAA